jgi:hypothetical protein
MTNMSHLWLELFAINAFVPCKKKKKERKSSAVRGGEDGGQWVPIYLGGSKRSRSATEQQGHCR